MILTDTGPSVDLLDNDDSNYALCTLILHRLPPEHLITTWPCFTEAMYLLGAIGGFRYQSALWHLQSSERLIIYIPSALEVDHIMVLMEKYSDTPMDLADASLLSLAETHAFTRIFTIDSDFNIYRLKDDNALKIIQ
jgi:hypothetical protein